MAKNFPYFKFVATEWLTGDIVFEPLDVQGLFINICAIYWQRDGDLSVEDVNKRYKQPTAMRSLSDRFVTLNEGKISIKFLDEQLEDAGHKSKTNSKNGKKGADARALKLKEIKANAKQPLSETEPPLSKEEEEEEEKKNKTIPSEIIFLEYCKLKLNEKYFSLEFSLKSKYMAWVENGWKTGENKKIKNWKSTILNTIPYLKSTATSQQGGMVR